MFENLKATAMGAASKGMETASKMGAVKSAIADKMKKVKKPLPTQASDKAKEMMTKNFG